MKSISDAEYELNVLNIVKKRRKQLTGMIIEHQTRIDQLKQDLELVQNDISKEAIKCTMDSISKEINIIKRKLEELEEKGEI
jgi:prefoldin subunit 5